MTTLIICPECGTRYEIKAAFPPEGRKVRCTKCGHVWQAKAVTAEAKAAPAPQAKPAPPAPPAAPKAPPQPAPAQAAPPPKAPPPPPPPPPAPPAAARPAPPPPPAAAPAPPPPPPQAMPAGMPPGPRVDAEFAFEDDEGAYAQVNTEPVPAAPPSPQPAKQGGLFAKIMGKRGDEPTAEPAAPPPPPEMAPQMPPPSPQADASFGDASFDVDFGGPEEQDAALADPDLVAAAFGESPAKEKKARKPLPIVPLGWGILALIVAIVGGLFVLAPGTTVSILPGAAKIYSMLGMPVGAQGLAFEGVRYGWTNDGSQTVLEVQGNVKNTSSATMSVPTVVIALRDENGEEISEWTTEVGAAELAAGEEAPFLRQIPSPPSNVRSLKVRFANAN